MAIVLLGEKARKQTLETWCDIRALLSRLFAHPYAISVQSELHDVTLPLTPYSLHTRIDVLSGRNFGDLKRIATTARRCVVRFAGWPAQQCLRHGMTFSLASGPHP